MSVKSLGIASLLLTLMPMLLFLAACQGSQADQAQAPEAAQAVKVGVMRVEPTVVHDVLLLPGETEAIEDVRLSADLGGQVEALGVAEGDLVKKGQTIAEIDVETLKTALDRARANYRMAEDQAQRRKKLIGKGVIGQEEYDKIETARVIALGELREAEVLYKKGMVTSPIDGRVNHLFVDAGEFVDKGGPVADLVNISRIRVNVNVPELEVRFLKVGQPSRVTLDAYPGRQWLGEVDFVAYKADPGTKTFHVRVVVDNADGDIRPGMIARCAFLKRSLEGALTAPLSALVDKGGERLIFVEKGGVAQGRTVELGVVERDRIQIVKGLEPGDNLIVSGQTDVEDGMKVQVR